MRNRTAVFLINLVQDVNIVRPSVFMATRHFELDLTGWVMNGDDERSVQLVAEGPSEGLDALERFIHAGPRSAMVETVDARRGPASGEFERFGIVRS